VTPELAMTNASAFVGWEHDPEITSQGTAQNYHMRMDWSDDDLYEFKIQDDGDLILHEDPGSDTAALDAKIFAANAWSQATVGVKRNGANLGLAPGLRTMQIVCSDRTLTDTDEIDLIVDGVTTTLVESTDFDCEGIGSEEICCDNLGVAIVTADIGFTPDCDTTAGTCYVTPDEDLVLADIQFVDGGVNDVGWTLTEGVTGSINLHGSVNVYDDAGDAAYWHKSHIAASSVSPGASGATLTVINTATLVWLLNDNTEYLYMCSDIHDDWDGVSDIVVEVTVALSGDEAANDDIQAEIIAEYVGDHEDIDTGLRTQTRSIDHDIVSDNNQGDVHHMTFILDHALGGQEIGVDDHLSLRFRLDVAGGAGNVAAVWFKDAIIKYRTPKPAPETGGTFPSEG
jgi:hypothetical protein